MPQSLGLLVGLGCISVSAVTDMYSINNILTGYKLAHQELSANQCPTAISTWPDCGVTMSPKSMCFQAGFAPKRALKR